MGEGIILEFINSLVLYFLSVFSINGLLLFYILKDIHKNNESIYSLLFTSPVLLFFCYMIIHNDKLDRMAIFLFIPILFMISLLNEDSKKTFRDEGTNSIIEKIGILSIDYIISKAMKGEVKVKVVDIYSKSARRKFIILKNIVNLMISFAFLVYVYLSKYTFTETKKIVFYILLIRFISRSIEICIAFYVDVVKDADKRSNLIPSDRIRLAIFSAIEITIMSVTLLSMLGNCLDFELISSSIINTLTFCSGAIKSPEDLLNYNKTIYFYRNLVFLVQGVTSFVLIVFSIAVYLNGENHDVDSRDVDIKLENLFIDTGVFKKEILKSGHFSIKQYKDLIHLYDVMRESYLEKIFEFDNKITECERVQKKFDYRVFKGDSYYEQTKYLIFMPIYMIKLRYLKYLLCNYKKKYKNTLIKKAYSRDYMFDFYKDFNIGLCNKINLLCLELYNSIKLQFKGTCSVLTVLLSKIYIILILLLIIFTI